jgi:hypothetical protein
MFLNVLIIVGIASFVALVVLGHLLLAGDLWRFWELERKPQESSGGGALRVPAE